jgi:hypothetical protein
MTRVPKSMKTEFIPGDCKFVRLLEDFHVCSDVLNRWIIVPAGFVFDLESVPLLRGSNPEAGCAHDYLCRKDSIPVVSSWVAAQVYFEVQDYFDKQESGMINCIWDWIRRYAKCSAVVIATPTYFHKHKVGDTYEDIRSA